MTTASHVQDSHPSTRRSRRERARSGRLPEQPTDEPPPALPSWMAEPQGQGLAGVPAPGALQLEVRRGDEPIARRTFQEAELSVGRSPKCTLFLDDATVSRRHATIERTIGGWVVRDRQSTNGVKVNGRAVREWILRPGDEVAVGAFVLQASFTPLPPPPRPAAAPATPEEAVFGRTIALPPARAEVDLRERSLNQRAWLRALEGAQRAGIKVCQLVVERDVFCLGGGEECDLRLQAALVPRVAAVIVRGWGGWSLIQVAPWPWVARINGRPVDDREWLEDGDHLQLPGGLRLSFHLGLP